MSEKSVSQSAVKEKWTAEQDELLINEVKQREALYNYRIKEFKNAQLKSHMWIEIGRILKLSGMYSFIIL